MKTVAMESFCVLEVILCWVVALPILLIAFLGFILGEKILTRPVEVVTPFPWVQSGRPAKGG